MRAIETATAAAQQARYLVPGPTGPEKPREVWRQNYTVATQHETELNGNISAERLRLKMLEHRASALEQESSSLVRRAAALERQESLVRDEIEHYEDEVNRLVLRLKSLQTERESLSQRIELLKCNTRGLREEIVNAEEELALDSLSLHEGASTKLIGL